MQLFDDEWLAASSQALGELPKVAGLDAVVSYAISGTPFGRLTLTVAVVDGVVGSVTSGKATDPDVAITVAYQDAVAILSGNMSGEAAYMNGALKVEGNYSLWLLHLRQVRQVALKALAPVMAQTQI